MALFRSYKFLLVYAEVSKVSISIQHWGTNQPTRESRGVPEAPQGGLGKAQDAMTLVNFLACTKDYWWLLKHYILPSYKQSTTPSS